MYEVYGVLKSVKSLNAMKIQEKKPRVMINALSVFLSSRAKKERRLLSDTFLLNFQV